MRYFTQLGDRILTRIITRAIFLHLTICVAALALVVMVPIFVWDFVQAVRLPSVLLKEGEVIQVPLVKRNIEHWDEKTDDYLCYVQMDYLAIPHRRPSAPVGMDSLNIYSHPEIGRDFGEMPKIVEVPANPDWHSVFEAAEKRPLAMAVLRLLGLLIVAAAVVYIAIRGYWLIKHGPHRQPAWSRR